MGPRLHYDGAAIEQGEYFDLGSYSRPVSTKTSTAQKWFDRGLIWSYAFNHEEAIHCFERANKADPNCLMVHWGLAYCLGPNYNKPWEAFDDDERAANLQRARVALHTAEGIGRNTPKAATPTEYALVCALQSRYSKNAAASITEKYASWNEDYAASMKRAYRDFGHDLDVAALYADSLMNLTPWSLWDLRTGKPSVRSRTLEAKSVLDRAIAQPGGSEHPGLLHLFVHLMEMSPEPESALPIANRLRGLVPDAGHLHHMPTHLDVLCGDWDRSIESNSDAIEADERYVVQAGSVNFYSLYRSHNYHFRVYSAMFAGKFQIALETVEMLEASLSDELLRVKSPPMADWLESFLSMRVHVLIRFGKWEELIRLQVPRDLQLYCVTISMIYYGKGVAFAAVGDVKEAENHLHLFYDAVSRVSSARTLFNNTALDILAVAAAMLEGELDYRCGNVDSAFKHLRKAIELSDTLPYDEPWGWMQPPRHAYGALLLDQDRAEEAAVEYKADLGLDETLPRALRHPNNIWALHGLNECFKKLGRKSDAALIEKKLKVCQATADVLVTSSCFCRNTVAGV